MSRVIHESAMRKHAADRVALEMRKPVRISRGLLLACEGAAIEAIDRVISAAIAQHRMASGTLDAPIAGLPARRGR